MMEKGKKAQFKRRKSARDKNELTLPEIVQNFADRGITGIDDALAGLYEIFGGAQRKMITKKHLQEVESLNKQPDSQTALKKVRGHKMNTEEPDKISLFESDMTQRLACRAGDFIIWCTWKNIFADPKHGLAINDLWEMRTGDFVTISNRTEDLPAWFTLHPTEVCNRLSYEMIMKLNNGYKPGTPVEGPNIWRPKSGDRIAWIGKRRPGMIQQGPVLSIIDFRESALVVGESVRALSMDEIVSYGSLSKQAQNPEELAACNEAVKVIRQMGVPDTFAPEWKLG